MNTLYRDRQSKMKELRKNGLTLQEVADLYGITRERVRQITSANLYRITKEEKDKNPKKFTRRKGIIWDREFKNNYLKDKHRENRNLAMDVLGGKCVRCGFNDIRALQIDHINGGGCKEIRTQSSYSRYKWIRNNSEEAKSKYQILCANCNWIKRVENDEVNIHRRNI